MNKRTNHGMIFVPILCLLLALLAFAPAWNGNDDAQPPMEEAASEPAVTSYHVKWNDIIPLIGSQLLYAPPPSATVETTPQVEEWVCPLTDEEVELIALLTMAEAEGECEYGQRLVIDTVLNRVDSEHFPGTVNDVVYQKNQYSSMTGERVTRCWVKEELCELVRSELKERTDYDVVFFRTKHYHSFGTPMFQVGAHYFSKYG